MRIDIYYSTSTNRYLYKSYNVGDIEYEHVSNMKIGDLAVIKGVRNKLILITINLDGQFIEFGFIKG